MNRHHRVSLPRGFSLLEVIVAIGILSIMTLGFTTLISQMMAGQKLTQARQDLITLGTEIQTMFQNETVCTSGLKGSNWDATKAAVQYPPPPNTVFAYNGLPFSFKVNADTLSDGTAMTTYNLTANKIQLVNAQSAGTDINGKEVYRAQIIGQFSPKDAGQGGLRDFGVRVLGSGYFTIDAGKVAACSADMPVNDPQAAKTCQTLGGTFNATTKKCELAPPASSAPNFSDPVVVAQICTGLGGTVTNGKCNLGTQGDTGDTGAAGGARWVSMGAVTVNPIQTCPTTGGAGMGSKLKDQCPGPVGSRCDKVGDVCCANPQWNPLLNLMISVARYRCE